MPTIDLNEKVKEKLRKFKNREGCKTYSEAVNLLLEIAKHKLEKNKRQY
ncbi:MAG: hypothetical protein ACP6IY_17065 [Promethearchaeia archaeon]